MLRAAERLRAVLGPASRGLKHAAPSRAADPGVQASQARLPGEAYAEGALGAAARQLSQRFIPQLELPKELEAAIQMVIRGRTMKSIRSDSTALTDRLKRMTRSVPRGGRNIVSVEENTTETTNMAIMRKINSQLDDDLEAPDAEEGEESEKKGEERGGKGKKEEKGGKGKGKKEEELLIVRDDSVPSYGEIESAAYVAARMPPTYSAIYRVLDEVAARAPGFSPRNMLDFGAGPATAAWAAWEVWPEAKGKVVAVDSSPHMRRIGSRMIASALDKVAEAGEGGEAEGAERFAAASRFGDVRYHSHLPPPSSSRGGEPGGWDLVTAAYVLGELEKKQRNSTITALWERTAEGGLLVLVEPGTPTGSMFISQARAQVLKIEDKRARKAAASSAAVLMGKPAAPPNVHVVAPCAHDGACPLDGNKGWCHFAQRVHRSNVHRLARAGKGGVSARSFQDEKFSYVVLRKAPRSPLPSYVGKTSTPAEGGGRRRKKGATKAVNLPLPRAGDLPAFVGLAAAAESMAPPPAKRVHATSSVVMLSDDQEEGEGGGEGPASNRLPSDGVWGVATSEEGEEQRKAAALLDRLEKQMLGETFAENAATEPELYPDFNPDDLEAAGPAGPKVRGRKGAPRSSARLQRLAALRGGGGGAPGGRGGGGGGGGGGGRGSEDQGRKGQEATGEEGSIGEGEEEGEEEEEEEETVMVEMVDWEYEGKAYLVDETSEIVYVAEAEHEWPTVCGKRVDGRLEQLDMEEMMNKGVVPAWALDDLIVQVVNKQTTETGELDADKISELASTFHDELPGGFKMREVRDGEEPGWKYEDEGEGLGDGQGEGLGDGQGDGQGDGEGEGQGDGEGEGQGQGGGDGGGESSSSSDSSDSSSDSGGDSSSDSDSDSDEELDGRSPEEEALEMAALEHVRASTGVWGRVMRPPKKNKGHVIMEMCCAVAGDPSQGVIERRTYSRKGQAFGEDAREWYKTARKSQWGDLWPHMGAPPDKPGPKSS